MSGVVEKIACHNIAESSSPKTPMSGVVEKNSCCDQKVTIISQYFGLRLGVEQNSVFVAFCDVNDSDDCQKWAMVKTIGENNEDLRSFQNVANRKYMCPDDRKINPHGVKTGAGNPYSWIVEDTRGLKKIFENPKENPVRAIKAVEENGAKLVKLLPWDENDEDPFMFDIKDC